jgi:hypothetical protein
MWTHGEKEYMHALGGGSVLALVLLDSAAGPDGRGIPLTEDKTNLLDSPVRPLFIYAIVCWDQ